MLLHSTRHPHGPAWLAQCSTLTAAQVAAIPVQHVDMALMGIEAPRRLVQCLLAGA